MNIELLGSAEIIMSNADSKHNYFGWPSVVKLPDGKLVAGASGFRLGHICPFGKGCISFSFDNGKSFTSAMPIIDTPLDDRDVGLCVFGENGLIVTSFNNSRQMQKYHGRGHNEQRKNYTYSYIDCISDEDEDNYIGSTFRISLDGGVTFGKIMKSPVTSPHGPTQLSDKTVLWVGSNYFKNNNVEEFDEYVAAYTLDTDSGEMRYVGRIPDITENGRLMKSCEPHVVQLPNGELVCHIRTEPNFTTYQSISSDKGRTWSVPKKILEDKGGAPCHLLLHSSGVLISLYGYREEPYEIRAMFSFDGGATWDKDNTLYVNGISGDIGYPCSAELPDGSIYTVFYAKTEENSPCVILGQRWRFVI